MVVSVNSGQSFNASEQSNARVDGGPMLADINPVGGQPERLPPVVADPRLIGMVVVIDVGDPPLVGPEMGLGVQQPILFVGRALNGLALDNDMNDGDLPSLADTLVETEASPEAPAEGVIPDLMETSVSTVTTESMDDFI